MTMYIMESVEYVRATRTNALKNHLGEFSVDQHVYPEYITYALCVRYKNRVALEENQQIMSIMAMAGKEGLIKRAVPWYTRWFGSFKLYGPRWQMW